MDSLMSTLTHAMTAAGEVLMKHYGTIREFDRKSDIDLVTVADKEAEAVIMDIIRGAHPGHEILAEESGLGKGTGTDGYRWLVDPVDGTTNYAHGLPFFSVSIGVEKDGEMVVAGVFNPHSDEIFLAEKGGGATLNGKKIVVSEIDTLRNALLISGFPYDRRERIHHYLKAWEIAIGRAQGVLRMGSAALELCFVACGRAEAYWEENLSPWDLGAGFLILEEAGGRVTNFDGERFNPYMKQILASNGRVHEECLELLHERRRAMEEMAARHG